MIEIPFDPNIHIGPITLAWHGIFTAVGIFFGVALPIRLLRGRVNEDAAYSVATWGVVGGIIGARLFHVADCWERCGYAADPVQILAIWSGGIAVWGAVVAGAMTGFVVALRLRLPIGATADGAAPGIGLGLAIGRIGDIINGEHLAVPCGGGPGICVGYTHPDTLGQGPDIPGRAFSGPDQWQGPVHLPVAYEMVWSLIGVGIALVLRRWLAGRYPEGRIFWMWLVWYAVGRVAFGFLRIGDPTPILVLRQDQVIALVSLLAAIPMLALLQLRAARRGSRAVGVGGGGAPPPPSQIEIPFAPDLVLGSLRIAWHSIFAFLGSGIAAVVAIRLSRWLVRDDRVHLYAIAMLVGGLVTARLGHVVDNWSLYAAAPERIFTLGGGGIAVTAAPIGSTIAGLLVARWLRLPAGFMLDVASIGIVFGLAIGRIGDIINGEHHAVACDGLAWCVRYTHPETLGQPHPVHPVVAYDALWDLVIVAVALAYWRRIRGSPPEGRVYWLVLALYGAGRSVSSFLRLDPVVLAGLQEAQILGIVYLIGGAAALAVLERRARRRPS